MELDERKKVTISLELAASFSEASVIASWLVTQLCVPNPELMVSEHVFYPGVLERLR